MRCSKCGAESPTGKKFCGDCGARLDSTAPEPAQVEPPKVIHGEQRHLTVLFCDLVGSTAITAQLDPEEWHGIAARYQKEAAEAATRFGGHVAKYLGDGLLVYFGYPQAHDDDAESAVRAGLAMIDAIPIERPRIPRLSSQRGLAFMPGKW
jgi:class 3 adenylate cyclase